MSDPFIKLQGAEIYKLVERLQLLQGAEFAFRLRSEARRREFEEAERRLAEEHRKVQSELADVKKTLREKLGVPEPKPVDEEKSGFGDVSDLFSKMQDIFDGNQMPPCDLLAPSGPDGPPCG